MPREVAAARWLARRLLVRAAGVNPSKSDEIVQTIRALDLAAIHPSARPSAIDVDKLTAARRVAMFRALDCPIRSFARGRRAQ